MRPSSDMIKSVAYSSLLFSTFTEAHLRMVQPRPINGDVDENNLPLGPGNPYPCQGYIPSNPYREAAQYVAGDGASINLEGTTTLGGGSCQVSLSYDNGTTFRVIQSIVGGCPLSKALDFTVPSSAPKGAALLAWTWFNKIGKSAMYMNCAWVNITAPDHHPRHKRASSDVSDIIRLDPQGNPAYYPPPSAYLQRRHGHGHGHNHLNPHRHAHTRRQRSTEAFESLPLVFKANILQSEYRTDEGCDVKFPQPGPFIRQGTSEDSACANTERGYSMLSSAQGWSDLRVRAPISGTTTVVLTRTLTPSGGASLPAPVSPTPIYTNTSTTTTVTTTSEPFSSSPVYPGGINITITVTTTERPTSTNTPSLRSSSRRPPTCPPHKRARPQVLRQDQRQTRLQRHPSHRRTTPARTLAPGVAIRTGRGSAAATTSRTG